MSDAPFRFDPRALFEVLNDHGVDYVVIGGVAATLHGSTLRTGDADICPDDDHANVARLAEALRSVDAAIRTDRDVVELPVSSELLRSAAIWNLTTRHGDLDIAFQPAGTDGFADLQRHAVVYDLDGTAVQVASLDDVIRSKTAADREKDRRDLPFLHALRRELDEGVD